MAKSIEFITLEELKTERSDLWEDWQNDIEHYRKHLWYRCPPGSVDSEGFPKADARRTAEFCQTVLDETGKTFRCPKLPPYKDGCSFNLTSGS